MLFLTYWELNESMPMEQSLKAGAGFFKYTRTAPIQAIQEALEQNGELLKTLGSL
jgi:hypothetical protein